MEDKQYFYTDRPKQGMDKLNTHEALHLTVLIYRYINLLKTEKILNLEKCAAHAQYIYILINTHKSLTIK